MRPADQRERVDGKVARLFHLDRQHIGVVARADGRAENHDRPDALAAADTDVGRGERVGRDVVHEMDAQKALPIRLDERVVIDHFEIIDAVERAAADRVAPAFVAAEIERHGSIRSCARGSFRELGRLQGLRAPDEIADRDAQGGVFVRHVDRIDLDEIAEILLERTLDEVLRGRGELVAVRREDQTQQAAAEVGPIDPFARRGEKHLLDQVADVRVVVDLGGPAALSK